MTTCYVVTLSLSALPLTGAAACSRILSTTLQSACLSLWIREKVRGNMLHVEGHILSELRLTYRWHFGAGESRKIIVGIGRERQLKECLSNHAAKSVLAQGGDAPQEK